MKAVLLVLVCCAVTGACSDEDDSIGSCDEVFAERAETRDLDNQVDCLDPADDSITVGGDRWICADGRKLFANEFGYGIVGEPWRTDGTNNDLSSDSPVIEAVRACGG